MANYSSTPRPAYVWDGVNNQWVPIGVGAHTHTTSDVSNLVPTATAAATAAIANFYSVGPTSSRPATPAIGYLYYDTTVQQLFNYSTIGWVVAGTIGQYAAVTGGTLYSDATYYYRVFTSTASLSVANLPLTADILVVAGGGGGGDWTAFTGRTGGGGAGGVAIAQSYSIPVATYTLTIGSGGPQRNASTSGLGINSTFGSLITAVGGGAGGYNDAIDGSSGGSGGGNWYTTSPSGGASTQTSGTGYVGYGNAGGPSNTASRYGGGGGGGAGAAGGGGTTAAGGAGGNGISGATVGLLDAIGAATSKGQLSGGHYYFA